MGMGTDLETFTQHEVRMHSWDFGVCNADQLPGLCATAQAGTATSLILDASAPSSSSSLTSCPTAISGFFQRCTASARYEPQAGMKRRKDFGLVVRPRLARRLLQSTPNSIRAHRMPPRSHAEAIYRLPNPTCRSGSPIDMLHALCPRPCLGLFLCLQNCDHNCKLALCKCPLVSRNLHPSKFPSFVPHTSATRAIFPHPFPFLHHAVLLQ